MFLRDGLHDLFIPGFPALMESFYIQEQLVERYLPKLHRHLVSELLFYATCSGLLYFKKSTKI